MRSEAGGPSGAPKDGVEHLRRELPRERVLLAWMETADERVRADRGFRTVPEARLRPDGVAGRGERLQGAGPGARPQRDHDPDLVEGFELASQGPKAVIALRRR